MTIYIEFTFDTCSEDGVITFTLRFEDYHDVFKMYEDAFKYTDKFYPDGKVISAKTIER